MSRELLESRARDCLLDEAEESQLSERSARHNGTVALSSLLKKSGFMEGWMNYAHLGEKQTNLSSERVFKVQQRNISLIGKKETSRKIQLQISMINPSTSFGNQIEGKQLKNVKRAKLKADREIEQSILLRIIQPQLSTQQVLFGHEIQLSNKQQIRETKQNIKTTSKERYPSVESLIHTRLQMQSQQINLKLLKERKTNLHLVSSQDNYSPEFPEIGLPKKLSARNQSSKIVGLFSLAQQRKRSTSQLAPYQNSLSHNSSSNSSNVKNVKCSQNISSSFNESALESCLQDYARPQLVSHRDSYKYSDDSETTTRPFTSKMSSRTQLSTQSNRQLHQCTIRSVSPQILYGKQTNRKETYLSSRPLSSKTDDMSIYSIPKKIKQTQQQHTTKDSIPLPQIISQIQAEKKSIGISRLDDIYSSIKRQVKQHKQIMTHLEKEQYLIDKNAVEQFEIKRNQTYLLWN